MKVERSFNRSAAKLLKVSMYEVSIGANNALGMRINLLEDKSFESLGIHLTPDEARAMAKLLIAMADKHDAGDYTIFLKTPADDSH